MKNYILIAMLLLVSFTGIFAEKTVYYENEISEHTYSNAVNILMDEIAPPTNLTATINNENNIILNWLAPSRLITRNLIAYKIYRNDSEIASVIPSILTFIDVGLDYSIHEYYVTAIYTESESEPSNSVYVTILDPEDILPPNNLTASVVDEDVTLCWEAPLRLIDRDLTAYKIYRNNEEISEVDGDVLTLTDYILSTGAYIYHVTAMYGDIESTNSNSVDVWVTVSTGGEYPYVDSFEAYPDFALEADPWTLVDGDLSSTYEFSDDTTFENSSLPMAYIVFNPSMTTPPLTGQEFEAAFGSKYMACFAATISPNNDWLITKEFSLGYLNAFRFWAKSLTADNGLERFNVLISAGSTNPNDFMPISGTTYTEAPRTWTQYSYNLDEFQNQNIRLAIQCVSSYASIFMVDHIRVESEVWENDDPTVPFMTTALISNYPNPFNPETTISYFVEEAGEVNLEVYNILGQKVKTLVNERKSPGTHDVVWNGKDENGKSVSSGIFFYRMKSGKYSSTKKMILMK